MFESISRHSEIYFVTGDETTEIRLIIGNKSVQVHEIMTLDNYSDEEVIEMATKIMSDILKKD